MYDKLTSVFICAHIGYITFPRYLMDLCDVLKFDL